MDEAQGKALEERMKLALAGDKRAYASVLQETAILLRPYLTRRLRQGSDVEDLLQEILVSIHKARHTYDCQRPYKPWALAIARFRLTDYLRKHYSDRLHGAAGLEEAEGFAITDVTKSDFSYESIKGEVEQLPGKQAVILQLMHEEGYTAREVADRIGMKESAVKVAAHRAYKVLKKKLENDN